MLSERTPSSRQAARRCCLDRTGAAVVGAVLMIVTGAITLADAVAAVDFRTIVVLFSMMIIVAHLRLAGGLAALARFISTRISHPAAFLVALVIAAGLLSALFVNDTVCLVFTPIVLDVAAARRQRPLPYLLALATASNIGNASTVTGNPQNILIASVSGISFSRFIASIGPIAVIGLAVDAALIYRFFCRVYYTDTMRMSVSRTSALALCVAAASAVATAQTAQPARRPAARTVPLGPAIHESPQMTCPAPLGSGVSSKQAFCDVLIGRDPAEGILITIPPHKGDVTLTFDLHNRHTFSEEQMKDPRAAYARYTASVGALTQDNTLISRAVVQNEFRSASDLIDRIGGGAGPGGLKAVAPTGQEAITLTIPEAESQVSILGEKLTVDRADGTATFTAPGRPIAIISNVMIEYHAPPPKPAARTPAKTAPKGPATKPPAAKSPPGL